MIRGYFSRRSISAAAVAAILLPAGLSLPAFGQSNAAPAAASTQSPRELGLDQAVALAIQNNLTTRLSKAGTEAARGRTLQSAASLLPSITGTVYQNRVFLENLVSLGFPRNSSLFSPLLGPFDVFDARIQLVQNILDLSSIRAFQAQRFGGEAAKLQEQLAAEQVAGAAALAYVEALRSAKALDAAQADLDLASALATLAQNQHHEGVATGLDVTRAETRSARAKLRVLEAGTESRQAELRLKRVVGLPLGGPVSLSDSFGPAQSEIPNEEVAVSSALSERLEARIAAFDAEADDYAWRSAQDQYFPTLSIHGDYGASGNLPDHNAVGTGTIGAILQVPIWNGGLIHGRSVEAAAQKTQADLRREDADAQIEEDVRLAVQSLSVAADQVSTARQARELAEREVQLARNRYEAGVGDNIELVNAQDGLAGARNDEVAALAGFETARVNLALAEGRMRSFHL